MKRGIVSFVACLGLLAAGASSAEDGYFVRGSGALPCSEALGIAQQEGPALVALVAWADGAISTVNRLRDDTFDLLPFEEPPGLIAQLALNLCQATPDAPFETALHRVFAALEPFRVRAPGDSQTLTANGASVRLRQETVRRVQERLIDLGHLSGGADGLFGPATRGALRSFQAAEGLPETALPDLATVLRLLPPGR